MVQDAELVARWKKGDKTAIEMLLQRYEARIYSFLLRILGDRHEAEDATQEVFVKVIQGLKTYRERGRFKSWLFQIAYREGLRAARRRARLPLRALDVADPDMALADPVDPAPHPDAIVMSEDEVIRIENAIRRLPPREREVVLLRVYSGLPFKEIARVIRCPLNTALGRMHNAGKRLRTILKGEGVS